MTRNINVSKLLTAILTLALAVAWAMSCCVVSRAAEAKTFEQTMEIRQTVSNNPLVDTYTYKLTPNIEGTPMPEGSVDGVYTFTLSGNDVKKIPVKYTVDKECNYQYYLERVEPDVPDGDTVTPEDHHFGYWFKTNKDTGELEIIPYTCYDNEFKIATDKDGNVTGIFLYNTITGPFSPGKSDQNGNKNSSNGNKSTNGTTAGRTTYSSGNSSRFAKYVNTEDGSRIVFWGSLLLIAAVGLIIMFLLKRRNKDPEETA